MLSSITDFVWANILMYLLFAASFFFMVYNRFFNLRILPHAFANFFSSTSGEQEKNATSTSKHEKHTISSAQALFTSLGSAVGTGSIAGVAIAIYYGGPGAVLWMWITTLIISVSSLSEHILGQLYKEKIDKTHFIGGIAYYIQKGLKSTFLAYFAAITVTVTYGLVFNTVQANTIAVAFKESWHLNILITAVCITFFASVYMFSGNHRIVRFSSRIVPIMGMFYILTAIYVVIANYKFVPSVFGQIFYGAFDLKEAGAGVLGYGISHIITTGIKRGMFATESGMGSAPNITASAHVAHPVEQGLMGMVGVLIISFIICTSTAMIVLVSGVYESGNNVLGIQLVQRALAKNFGAVGDDLIAIFIFMFAFTSILGNYTYAENNIKFITKNKKFLLILKLVAIVCVFVGSMAKLDLVWNIADLAIAFLVCINITTLLILSRQVRAVVKDYVMQRKKGIKNPVFKKSDVPLLKDNQKIIW